MTIYVVRRFFPDFICKLTNGEYLIIETKGQDNEQNRTEQNEPTLTNGAEQ